MQSDQRFVGGVAAFSTHPHVAHAAGECAGRLIDAGVHRPELVVLAVAAGFAEKLGDVGSLVRSLLAPQTLLGVAVEGVADGEVLATDAGIAMLAWSPGPTHGEYRPVVTAVRAAPERLSDLAALTGGAAVLFADPFSIETDDLLAAIDRSTVDRCNGGFLSTARRRGASRLLVGDQLYSDGVVGISIAAGHATTLASSGGALMGAPVRFGSASSVLTTVGGVPALDAYSAMLADLGCEVDAVDAVELGLLHLAVLPPGVADSQRPSGPTRPELPAVPVGRELADTVRVLGVEVVGGEPVGLRMERPVPPDALGFWESFMDWSQESDLARQRSDLGARFDAALVVGDPLRLARSPMYRSGDHGELSSGATIGLVCSEVFERSHGAARCSSDRLVVTGLSDS